MTVTSPDKPPAKTMSKKKLLAIGALILAALVGIPLAAAQLLGGAGGDTTLASHQYRVVAQEPVTNSVLVSGHIKAGKNATVRTTLTTPVDRVYVAVGDRVTQGQQLVSISTTELQSQLDSALSQRSSATEQANQSVAQAQTALSQYQQRLSEGLAPEINSAEAALRDATEAYDKAQRDFEVAKSKVDTGRAPELISAQQQVDGARVGLLNAALGATRAGVSSAVEITGTKPETNPDGSPIPEQAINTHLNTVDATAGVVTATQNLNLAQRAYEDALATVNTQLADLQRAVADAFNRKKDAAVSLESAKLASTEHLTSLQDAVTNAQNAASNAATSQSSTTDKLTQDIAQGTVTAPFDGIVTSISATAGVPASGALLTIADTSTMMVTTEIKELDLPKVKVGQKVEITTALSGKKVYHGTVTTVSPVASNLKNSGDGPAAGAGAPIDDKPTFAVDITIDDADENIRVGGTAKAKIITLSQDDGFKVARDAIIEGPDGKHYVLVVTGDGDTGTVEKREVTPGIANDFDRAVTGDIHAGDRVINQGEKFLNLEGKKISLMTQDADGDHDSK